MRQLDIMVDLLDTFPQFHDYWRRYHSESLDNQIEGWETSYMAQWPELLSKQIEDYASEGFDWKVIARENVFPTLGQRIGDMEIAHHNLLVIIHPTIEKACEILQFDREVMAVIYAGIGLGAGWATTYNEKPAVLLGLENIAECGWIDKESLVGLVAHEIGHLVHFGRRERAGIEMGSGPWWQLFTEGVAMRCEHLVSGGESWHMRERNGSDNWLKWCQANRSRLAALYLEYIDTGQPVRPFFGSWYDIEGYRQTGYFLGHELVKSLEVENVLNDITLWSEDDPRLQSALKSIAGDS